MEYQNDVKNQIEIIQALQKYVEGRMVLVKGGISLCSMSWLIFIAM
jgi:hypothetical protein